MTNTQQSTISGEPRPAKPIAVVMGVAGCGKSAVGSALAERLGCRFVEGDTLHPAENVARMARGEPLTDELRRGWLDRVGAEVAETVVHGAGVVAACSALKRIYRDRLREREPRIMFIYIAVDPATAAQRVGSRKGHFMPASLVASQFADLQPPQIDEYALTLDGMSPIDQLVEIAAERLLRPAWSESGSVSFAAPR